jgi:hypothetical protein
MCGFRQTTTEFWSLRLWRVLKVLNADWVGIYRLHGHSGGFVHDDDHRTMRLFCWVDSLFRFDITYPFLFKLENMQCT